MVSKQLSFLSPATVVAGIAFLVAMAEANPLSTRNYKKGLGMNVAHSCNALAEHTTSSWYYSWGGTSAFSNGLCGNPSNAETQARSAGIEFIPMFWNSIPAFAGTRMVNNEIHSNLQNSDYLLTFNEPELPEQANLSAQQAAEMWPTIEAIAAAYNVEIVAPCVTQDLGLDWYEAWTTECNSMYGRDCEYDYTCIHMYYQPFTENTSERCDSSDREWACIQQGDEQGPSRAEYKLNQWATKYPGKPIWVTELACAPWGSSNGCSPQEHTDIMNQLVPVLEASPDVYRYAWFTAYAGHGGGGDWIGNGLTEPVWDYTWGYGCQNRKWLNAFGTDASWKIQTKSQCFQLADTDADCAQPLAISMDDDACYCARTTCNLETTWGAMNTWIEVGIRGSSALTAMGELYETFGSPDPTSSPSDVPSSSPTESSDVPSSSPTESSDAPSFSPTESSGVPSSSPTESSDVPSSSPTESSGVPSSSPTESSDVPSSSPTESSDVSSLAPTSSPSFLPSSSPTPPEEEELCEDNDEYRHKNKKKKSCAWIGKKWKRRKKLCKKNVVKLNCPEACRICP